MAALALAFVLMAAAAPFELRHPIMVLGRTGMWCARPSMRLGEPRYTFIRWEEIDSMRVASTQCGPFLQVWTTSNPRPAVLSKRFWTAGPTAHMWLWFLSLRRDDLFREIEARGGGRGIDLG